MGFAWELKFTRDKKLSETKFDELKEFREENTHYTVSKTSNNNLGIWVDLQRTKQKHNKLSKERDYWLDSLGSRWRNKHT